MFDACVVAAWLNDPKADVTERVKRGLCEQLYSAMELVRLRLEDDAAERRDYWKACAASLGWTVEVAPASSHSGQHRRPCERARFACSSRFARLPPRGSS